MQISYRGTRVQNEVQQKLVLVARRFVLLLCYRKLM